MVSPNKGKKILNVHPDVDFFVFGGLADCILDVVWKKEKTSGHNGFLYVAMKKGLEDELKEAARTGELPVKDNLTFGPHQLLFGRALLEGLVRFDDLQKYLFTKGFSLRRRLM